jgi:hypothetical protein
MSNEARANVYRRSGANLAVYDQTDFSRAAANIDVQQSYTLVAAVQHRAGAMRRHDRFQSRPGSGAHEAPRFVGK